ncbi:DUF4446 family protein [Paenibacillus psychroresistens]|uniref:DUF4446 family protein n=1 Tax=Paenibacillus psychroresistens TaxID=1778678 RepID=A0A6B8RVI7_9BACL|nr:DUF4446 family protein [Paenibacillus psychroresistens]QGQ99882.1 DUF4446 family protein [Paenibacillus psychroresistens]
MGVLTDLDQGIVIISFTALFIILLILLLINMRQLKSVRTRYNQMINGGNAENVEQVLIGLQNNINQLTQQNNSQQAEVDQIKQQMKKMKSHLGVQRYNAFSQDGGSDLSFSIAILDDQQDGVVLTGIHGREQTFIYAKPVEKGQSTYSLSPEEKTLIDQIAVKSNA